MKAAVYKSYGPPEVLRIEEVEKPSIRDGQGDRVLIKVHSASVNPYDYLHRKGFLPTRLENGLTKPKYQILGIDASGTVEAVGENVTRINIGDRVFGNCLGSHAEFVLARESRISKMADQMTYNDAAAIPTAALTALQALRDVAQIKPGQKVLIYGASGGIGHFAVQLARLYDAEVTAVCSTPNLQWVRDLGAHEMIDYTKDDFTKIGNKYDIILDAVGKRTYFSCKPSLTKTGVFITENPLKAKFQIVQILLSKLTGDKRLKMHLSRSNYEDFDFLRQLFEEEKLKPVIDEVYQLDRIVDAHRHVEGEHTKGKVVIEIQTG